MHEIEYKWRDQWLRPELRPVALHDLTCSCEFIPDWLEMVPGAPGHAQEVSRERQQSQLLFHLQATGHNLRT